jgi:hypothetical protein
VRLFSRRVQAVTASRTAVWLAGLAALLILLISRLHYAPKYLFFFDNANFALAIRHFDPAMHQPQPPGYPMFVALLKLLNLFVRDANWSLLVAGIIGSAVALVLLWLWADRMCGRLPAYFSTALFLFHPVFWVAGVANPVRVFLAVAATAVGLASWETIRSEAPARKFYVTAAIYGLVSGFRPETLVLLAPMWLTVGIYRKLRTSVLLGAFLILLGSTSVWLLPMAVRMHGIGRMWHEFADYLREYSVGYTVVYGASIGPSLATIREALIWSLGMTVVWIWVLPFVWKRFVSLWDRPRILLAAVALMPPLLFHALVHVRDIDQTLVSIPITCVAGGVALAAIPSRNLMITAALLAVTSSYWSFSRPIFSDMIAASEIHIRYVQTWTVSTYDALNQIRSGRSGIVAIWDRTVVPWRNVSYYYPDLPLLVISETQPFWVHRHRSEPATAEPDGTLALPRSTEYLVFGLSSSEAEKAARTWAGTRRVGPLLCLDLKQEKYVQVGAFVLRAAP